MSEEKTQINIPNVPLNIYEILLKAAQAESRSLANYLRIVLEDHVEELERKSQKKQPLATK